MDRISMNILLQLIVNSAILFTSLMIAAFVANILIRGSQTLYFKWTYKNDPWADQKQHSIFDFLIHATLLVTIASLTVAALLWVTVLALT